MSEFSFKLPDLGEGIVVSEIVDWHVNVGEMVEEDQHIVDVMTDKAVVEVTSPVAGIVQKLACEAGIEIAVGSELILLNTGAGPKNEAPNTPSETSSAKDEPEQLPVAKKTETPSQAKPAATVLNKVVLSSPSVRKQARELNIDLSLVSGSGKGGRINNSDLERFVANGAEQVSLNPPSPSPSLSSGNITPIKVKGLRKVIAQRMLESKRNIPHYSYIEEVDLTALEALRSHLNKERSADQIKLTLLPFIMKALVKVVKQFPHCNAHYDEENALLNQHQDVHLGIATMTEQGLMVPVVKDVQSLDIWQCASELSQVTDLARTSKASSAQLSGSTLTITSLGAIGGIATTPIINAPETCIIGINKMQQRPVVIDGQIVVRTMMNLSSSFDHRIVDGYDGALMIQALKNLLENPGAIFV
jgi:2-oxoisovalerate dehydrogenase E2 component (dihydrolipoyl transacylase)